MNTQDLTLVRYDAACHALAEAKVVDEVLKIRDVHEGLRAYARQAKNRNLEIDAAEIRIRAERRVGELIGAQKKGVGLNRGAKGSVVTGSQRDPVKDERPTLAEVGVGKHLADRARKLAILPVQTFENKLQAWRDKGMAEAERVRVDILAPFVRQAQNSGDYEWYTPGEIIERARKVLGGIDLDPASCEAANRVVKATRIFTESDDGLTQKWEGRVWLNPPYTTKLIVPFCEKLAAEVQNGSVSAAVAIMNTGTETGWFQALGRVASAVCFPSGRVQFWHLGKVSTTPLQGQAIFYIGPKPATFHALFSDLGLIFWAKP